MTAQPVPRRILVTRMKFIGDIVLTTPIIRSLRTALPDAYIAYMGDAGAVTLLEQNPYLNEIIPFDFSARPCASSRGLHGSCAAGSSIRSSISSAIRAAHS